MKIRKIMAIVIFVFLALAGVFAVGLSFFAKSKYDNARDKLAEELPDKFRIQEFSSNDQAQLRAIEGQWSCTNSEINGPHSLALKTARMKPTVSSIPNLFNYEIPPYAWFDLEQNTRNMTIASLQSIIVPISIDQTIYMSKDKSVAFILHSGKAASIFKNTDKGLQESLWTNGVIDRRF